MLIFFLVYVILCTNYPDVFVQYFYEVLLSAGAVPA